MTKLAAVARFALAEFGPLIVFWLLALAFGVKPAILGSIVFIIADAVWRWRKGLKFTRLYSLVSALTLVFGFVDLVATSPFMLKYEAAVSNVVTGVAFVVGAVGEKSIIQDVAEQRGESFVATDEIRTFFRLFTLVWAAYFFLKAILFVWMAWTMPMLEAMGPALSDRRRQSRPDDRNQRHTRATALLSLPALRPVAKSDPGRARRPKPGELTHDHSLR
jgi:intracellular septation protein A